MTRVWVLQMSMRAAVPTNQQQQQQAGAPPNQVAQSGPAPPQGPILRLSNPGANPQLRSLLLSQQQPVRLRASSFFFFFIPRRRVWRGSFPVCASAAGRRGSHAGHDAPPGLRPADGPSNARRRRSDAGPVEAAVGRSGNTPPHHPSEAQELTNQANLH